MKIYVFLRPKISRIGMSAGICRIFIMCPKGGGGSKIRILTCVRGGGGLKIRIFPCLRGGGALKTRIFVCPREAAD